MDDEECKKLTDLPCYVKVTIGVIVPRKGPSGLHRFELCQGQKCVKAGSVAQFGSRNSPPPKLSSKEVVDNENFKLVEVDIINRKQITNLMAERGWSFKKPLVAKMICWDCTGINQKLDWAETGLPEAVVILEWTGYGKKKILLKSKVIISPKEKRRRYGNLLDPYEKKTSRDYAEKEEQRLFLNFGGVFDIF